MSSALYLDWSFSFADSDSSAFASPSFSYFCRHIWESPTDLERRRRASFFEALSSSSCPLVRSTSCSRFLVIGHSLRKVTQTSWDLPKLPQQEGSLFCLGLAHLVHLAQLSGEGLPELGQHRVVVLHLFDAVQKVSVLHDHLLPRVVVIR